jgi:Heparinase II/III-like protein
MLISPNDRAIVQLATYFVSDATARGYGQGFLNNVIPDYTGPMFNDEPEYWLDFLFALDQTATPETDLPLSYVAPGSGWVNMRSGWGANATSVSVEGAPVINESHQHVDVGSFVIWNGGWLAGDASTWSPSGEIQTPDAHNMVNVSGVEPNVASVPGAMQFHDEAAYGYTQTDGSNEFATSSASLIAEWTRELVYLRAQGVLVVYDRVSPSSGSSQTYDWRVHFPVQPTLSGSSYTATSNGSSIALQPVSGGTPKVAPDTDLSSPATSYRVQEAPTQTPARLLNLIGVATGAPPNVTSQHVTGTQVEGVLWSNQVVMFSSNARGAAASLPFSYTVPTVATPLTHTIANLRSAIDVAVTRSGVQTTVTVSAGSQYAPSAAGTVQFTQ